MQHNPATTGRKTALVTGASHGMGQEFAKLLAKDGYNLVVVARTEAELNALKEKLQNEYEVQVTVIVRDLSIMGAAKYIYEELTRQGMAVEVLINDAGAGDFGVFVEQDPDRQAELIHLNVLTLTQLTRYFLPDMVKAGRGKILNLSSIAAFVPGPLHAVYHATKAYVQSLTDSLADELKDTPVTITALAPGPVNTHFPQEANMTESKAFAKPDKIAQPEDVAEFGYRALMHGDEKAVHGLMSKLMVTLSGSLPTSWKDLMIHQMHDPTPESGLPKTAGEALGTANK